MTVTCIGACYAAYRALPITLQATGTEIAADKCRPGKRIAEPGERGNELPDQSYRFVADDDAGQLVGVIDVFALRWRRARGRGSIVLGVRASAQGRGVGRALLDAAITERRRRQMRRLELSAMRHNQVAVRLYEACGFEMEGLRCSSVCVDGKFVDEVYMGLVLDRGIPA